MPKYVIALLVAGSFLAQAGGAMALTFSSSSTSSGGGQQGEGGGNDGVQGEADQKAKQGMDLMKKKHSPVTIPGMGKMGEAPQGDGKGDTQQ